ncbi:U3 small nucleolar RNA-associated protein 13 [Malassezia sp. CBS 17886]|nr:U3 small nucleolar RNA-associated protein 13 [Malassezia sp. CBS 17886]
MSAPGAAAGRVPLCTSFAKSYSLQPFYSGGAIAATADGTQLAASFGTDVNIVEAATARVLRCLSGDGEEVSSLALAPNDTVLVTVTRSLALQFYALPDYAKTRSVPKSHEAPVALMSIDPTSSLVATGSADGVVKVWDLAGGFCTHVFRGHGGVISALRWNVPSGQTARDARTVQLVTGCVDGKVRVWDLQAPSQATAKPVAVLNAHAGVVRGIAVSADGTTMVTGARDESLALWERQGSTRWHRRELLVAGERVEAVGFLYDTPYFYTAGSLGALRVWDSRTGNVAVALPHTPSQQDAEEDELRGLTDAFFLPEAATVVAVTATQDIALYRVDSTVPPCPVLTRELVGYNDEIVDLALVNRTGGSDGGGGGGEHVLAVASNNSQLRMYNLDTQNHDVVLLDGHADMVLSLDTSADGAWLASGSKDRSARIWAPAPRTQGRPSWKCIAVCEGHAESVGSVAFARRPEGGVGVPFLVTASQDRTVKVWDVSAVDAAHGDARGAGRGSDSSAQGPDAAAHLASMATLKIHDKDINAIDVSPNNALLLSGSQDRTARVFRLQYTAPSKANSNTARTQLQPLATCRGHKRGIWSVQFSPTEQAFATASSDNTVRLWSLGDFACVRVFEGHAGSVLRLRFLPGGAQLASAGNDGLVKVWNVKDEACAATIDAADDKIWALVVRGAGETPLELISGAADSMVSVWRDETAAVETARAAEKHEVVEREQAFANLIVLKDYRNAIALAFQLKQPRRLLALFTQVATQRGDGEAVAAIDQLLADALGSTPAHADADASISGLAAVDQILAELPHAQLAQLLLYIRDWNTSARTAPVAQLLLHAIVRLHSAESIADAFAKAAKGDESTSSLASVLEALMPYTERHYARADRMLVESAMLEYTLQAMGGADQDAVDMPVDRHADVVVEHGEDANGGDTNDWVMG